MSVPIYSSANVDTIEYVLRHSEAKAIFVGKLDDCDTMPASYHWDDLLE